MYAHQKPKTTKKRKGRTQRKTNCHNLLSDSPPAHNTVPKNVVDIMGSVPINVLMEHIIKRYNAPEFKEEDYSKYIKNECAGCGRKMNNNWGNYMLRGNYCTDCSNEASNKVTDNIKHKNK